jgi:hypothetical protein
VFAAAAALALAADARAFVRETTVPGAPAAGVRLWWGCSPTLVMNATGSDGVRNAGTGGFVPRPCGDEAAARGAVANAMAAWAQDCSGLRFQDGGTSTLTIVGNDGTNLILFRGGDCQDPALVASNDPCHANASCARKYNCWEHGSSGLGADAVAVTWNTYSLQTGQIVDSDIEFFGWSGGDTPPLGAPYSNGNYFTCATSNTTCTLYGQPGCNWDDVTTIAIHELGHVLGLDHVCESGAAYLDFDPAGSCDSTSVMRTNGQPGDVKQVVSADDRSGVCAIYPSSKGILSTTCGAPQEEKKGGGCSSGSAGPLSLVLLAVWAGMRRRGLNRGGSR